MADVNPNQDLRFKEIMRRMLPSAYMMFYVFVAWKLTDTQLSKFGQSIMNITVDMGGWIRFSFLVVATYMMGYVINILASFLERNIVYDLFQISRPSMNVLNGKGHYIVSSVHKIVQDSGVKTDTNGEVCQKQASDILRFVKGKIKRRDNLVEDMYYQSILARNLLCAHVIGVVLVFVLTIGLKCCILAAFLIVSIFLFVLFWKEWRRKNSVYVRNIFEEYLNKDKQ